MVIVTAFIAVFIYPGEITSPFVLESEISPLRECLLTDRGNIRYLHLSLAADGRCSCIFHSDSSSFCVGSRGISPHTNIFAKSLP